MIKTLARIATVLAGVSTIMGLTACGGEKNVELDLSDGISFDNEFEIDLFEKYIRLDRCVTRLGSRIGFRNDRGPLTCGIPPRLTRNCALNFAPGRPI